MIVFRNKEYTFPYDSDIVVDLFDDFTINTIQPTYLEEYHQNVSKTWISTHVGRICYVYETHCIRLYNF